jgi:phage shock protein C
MEEEKKLTKSDSRWLAGVCGGIAEYFGIDKEIVRLAWLLLSIVTVAFPGIIMYAILSIIMPSKRR